MIKNTLRGAVSGLILGLAALSASCASFELVSQRPAPGAKADAVSAATSESDAPAAAYPAPKAAPAPETDATTAATE